MAKKITKKKIAAPSRISPAKIRADEASSLMNTYRRPPVVFTHGRGCRLYDSQNRAYLDFLGGIAVNALGYSNPRLVRVIRREAGRHAIVVLRVQSKCVVRDINVRRADKF